MELKAYRALCSAIHVEDGILFLPFFGIFAHLRDKKLEGSYSYGLQSNLYPKTVSEIEEGK